MSLLRYVLLGLVVAGATWSPSYAGHEGKSTAKRHVISMVIFPRRNVKTTYRMFQPMAEHLSSVLDRKVVLITPKNFQSFWEMLDKGQFDLVHLNQYHYIQSTAAHGYEAILKNVEFGSPNMRGVVMTRKDSGIESIEDLRGKKILFGGGPRAMQSYIIPTWILRKAGLKKGDYQEVFAKNPPNALISIFHRQADAAGVGNAALRLNVVKNSVDITQMKTLVEGPDLPQLVWAVKKSMKPELKQAIRKQMIGLAHHTAGQVVLDKAQLTSLVAAEDSEYDPYRNIVSEMKSWSDGEAQ